MQVKASDSGNPLLTNNMSLNLFVLDQKDNAPEILDPTLPADMFHHHGTGTLLHRTWLPGDQGGYRQRLVSEHQAYHLFKASEPGLFMVGLHTGKVCTAWVLLHRDWLKQSLVMVVQDQGQPPLSATFTLTEALAHSIPGGLADLNSLEVLTYPEISDLTLYLVVTVAAVSCIFLTFVIVCSGCGIGTSQICCRLQGLDWLCLLLCGRG
ncbi:protocadherin gamma-A9-like [Prionailurus viverrinus]|uniref:protocadherin gamma-A9-like n=1 Tax=Prionailurus viverrinus TaxID=61388 RepID=UPI001FF5CE89|nr:protocadherin gamma-A9-like [Prionailurus viverrinus]